MSVTYITFCKKSSRA